MTTMAYTFSGVATVWWEGWVGAGQGRASVVAADSTETGEHS